LTSLAKIQKNSEGINILKKKWVYKEHDENKVVSLCRQYNIPRLAAAVLQNRINVLGRDFDKMRENLTDMLYDAGLLKDIDRAVARIKDAVANNEHITVYGDFDADGVTSTAILYMYLYDKGASVDYYIPDRVEEGYGINKDALDKIRNRGTKLIITVDTGVTAVDEVEYAQSIGMDVIVTDHHECKSSVPSCHAVVNPKREDCTYPFEELAGVGVVFKLIWALEGGNNISRLLDKYIGLVCLGTIADVAPLTGENRIFVSLGLKDFADSENEGIKALLDVTNLKGKKISAGHIGFIIAPRINAAGRLGSAYKSLELFLCNDRNRALEIAGELSEENKCRQNLEQQIFQEAVSVIEKNRLFDKKVIVVAARGWHHGVIGIVSSKITEKYYRPSVLISIEGEEGKGSGRSIHGFNLFEGLTYAGDCLTNFGGHSLAAGLSVKTENIKKFSEKINEYADKVLSQDDFVPTVYIDARLEKNDVTVENVEQLSLLEPYGMGNPLPVFSYDNAKITLITTLGEGKHLKIIAEKEGRRLEAIGFNMGELADYIKLGDIISIAGTLNVNLFGGVKKVQLMIKDIKKQAASR
jgi:single-stranded-DNA-specific exonuclease